MNKFEEILSREGKKVRPSTWFSMKMRLRIMRKGWHLFWAERAFSFRYAVVTAVLIVLLGGGGVGVGSYAYASDEVTEGTPLYPIKIGLEKIEEMMPRAPEDVPKFQLKQARRRLAEADKIAERLEKQGQIMEAEQEAFRKTFENCENHIQSVMRQAEQEYDPVKAKQLVDEMRKNFQVMAGQVDNMENRPSLEPFRGRIHDMREGMRYRMERIDEAGDDIQDAMMMRQERVKLYFSVDDNEDLTLRYSR
jgi:hypothetical protein